MRSRPRWSLAHLDNLLAVLDHTIYDSTLPDPSPAIASSWQRFYPSISHYLIPSPAVCYCGPSSIPNSGLGFYLYDPDNDFHAGAVVGECFGPSTRSGDIHPRYLARNAPVPPSARAKGAYLLRHGSYLVDCAQECAMGYLNDPFTLANCFFQPDPSNPCRLLIVLRVGLRRGQLHELFVNYDKPYWETHAEYLPPRRPTPLFRLL